jgi:D-glycero-alpha-D-manno-heptose-7-phosphate kinase
MVWRARRRFNGRMLVKCTAPIRICDLGGWTDTWFAETGRVLNIAVFPSVEVSVETRRKRAGEMAVTIHAENYKDSYEVGLTGRNWTKHPLIEAAIRVLELPRNLHLDVSIYSDAPVGASTGTSAAVSVAIIGALDLVSGGSLTSYGIARKAHYVETEMLRYQAGIQDQLASAYGGVCFIEMNRYPEASVSPIYLAEKTVWELESRLLLVYLGRPHSSSEVHRIVIDRLERSPEFRRSLEPLREAALQGKNALLRGDLGAFGKAMIANTRAQEELHPDLLGERARRVIEIAKRFGVLGWKLNGAGGAGGSVTLLLDGDTHRKHGLVGAIEAANSDFKHIPIRLAPYGLRRWVASDG